MHEMKIHKSFPNYKLHPDGLVWSNKINAYMKVRVNPNGYAQVGLRNWNNSRKMMYVHRLIAEVFIPKTKDCGGHVNHKDGDKQNNHFKNLEWVNPKENMKHAREIGLHDQDGLNNSQAKFSQETLDKVHELIAKRVPQRDIARILKMSQQHVSQIHRGTRRNVKR